MLRNHVLLIQLKNIILTTYLCNIRYDLSSYVVDHVNIGHSEIQFINDIIQTMVTSSIFLTVNVKHYLSHTYSLFQQQQSSQKLLNEPKEETLPSQSKQQGNVRHNNNHCI